MFNEKDEKIIRVFTELGMPKNLAKTLLYISQVDECRSSEIERHANLRQPEVSIAMQELQRKGWITKRDLKKKGKGRPVHLYRLTSPIDEIVKKFEEEKIQEIEHIKKDLSELRELLEKR
ncbi:MAG: ArsR family transcriptional regulator [Thermoplasmata archaeon]|nr:MAG: ArsR family transcriptional regulator [Thermoplasmata archaeon]